MVLAFAFPEILLEDDRIRKLVQNSDSTIAQFIVAMPKQMLQHHNDTFSRMITHHKAGIIGWMLKLLSDGWNFLFRGHREKRNKKRVKTFIQKQLTKQDTSSALLQAYIALHGLLGQQQNVVEAAEHFNSTDEDEPVKRIEALCELANLCIAGKARVQTSVALRELVRIADMYLQENPKDEYVATMKSDAVKLLRSLPLTFISEAPCALPTAKQKPTTFPFWEQDSGATNKQTTCSTHSPDAEEISTSSQSI